MIDSTQPALKNLLQDWINDRQQALREQLLEALRESQDRLVPDEALLESLTAAATPPPPPPPEPAPDPDADLGAGLDLVAEAPSQGETLKRLLDAATRFSGRSALYVLKQGIASLYAQRGFGAQAPRLGLPVVPPPELEELIQAPVGLLSDGPAYLALLGPLAAEPAADSRIIPLHLRRKTVALLLADSGTEPALAFPSQLRALALGAESRLSFLAGARDEERAAPAEPNPSMPTQKIPETLADPAVPALDPTVRSNAERSARVLVGDIELYFPTKVAQGQHVGNLYASMRDELDRSRASFVERYGADLESQHRIFYKTVVQQLCAVDPSRLGPAPWANV